MLILWYNSIIKFGENMIKPINEINNISKIETIKGRLLSLLGIDIKWKFNNLFDN
jgi:hypothetical protein